MYLRQPCLETVRNGRYLHFRIASGMFISTARSVQLRLAKRPVTEALAIGARSALRASGTSISTLESRMSKSIKVKRYAAYVAQSCRCFYCTVPMWEGEPDQFAAKYGITLRQARLLLCTAEHLEPKSEGGSNAAANIVAACLNCNRTRHRARVPREPAAYRQKVRSRMARDRWLPNGLARLVR
jgi:hypothetical protein